VQRDGALGDPPARGLLELGALLHPVWASFISHDCPTNIDTSGGRRYIAATLLFDERSLNMLQETGVKASGAGGKVVGPADGKSGSLGMIGVRFMIDGDETAGRFSLVEHPMPPRALAAPLHRHLREDEYSFVLEGRVGALLGDEVVVAGPGDLLFKPRNQWHTFWNAGDEPARILEIIAPSGFERFFDELVGLGGAVNADPRALAELCERYGLEMQPDTIPGLVERFGLRAPGDSA
jgi:mannose-6-phosphate isomerase-like protein (cupin superfamily)